ncbi:unnamed protein product, partial [Nesidiocoris tenuis]
AAKNRTKIKFDGDADVVLLKEVAVENPFEDGGKWKLIAEKMKRIIPKVSNRVEYSFIEISMKSTS